MLRVISFIVFFVLAFFVLFELRTSFSFFQFSHDLFQPQSLKGVLKVVAYGAAYFITLGSLLLLLLLKSKKLFIFSLVLISLTILIDSTYYFNDLNRGFSTGQFVTAVNEKAHFMDAALSFYHGFFKSLLFLGVFLGLVWLVRKTIERRFHFSAFLFLVLSFVGAKVIANVTVDSVHNFPSFVKVPLSIYNAYEWGLMNIPFKSRDKVKVLPVDPPQYKHIILIVDESVRGDYLSVNGFAKQTTPYVESLDNLLTLGTISSVANDSANTNYILRNGITVDELPDQAFNTLSKPTIFQYAKEAGFTTFFLDAQSNYEGLQNYMSSFDLDSVDHFITLKNKDDYALSDRRMLKKYLGFREGQSEKTFTYFVKYGSHFKWQLNYPQDKQVFNPTLSIYEGLSFNNREKAVNTYLNSLRWGVDDFFKSLLSELNTRDTLIIYTSDHGQNILENGIVVTHGLAENPPSTMAKVPLFFYADDLSSINNKFKKVNLNSYSQFQLFPTVLSLLGYSDSVVEKYGFPFWGNEENASKRVFFSGALFGNGHLNSFK